MIDPPFSVPYGHTSDIKQRLEDSLLLQFYKLNKQDLIDCAGWVYSLVLRSQYKDKLVQPDGFDFLCELLTMVFLTAPTQLQIARGTQMENVYGAAILRHLPNVPSLQDFFASYGGLRYRKEWNEVRDLIIYVAIQAFKNDVAGWGSKEIEEAKTRFQELVNGTRLLKNARPFFH